MPGIILILIALLIGSISGVFRCIPNQKKVVGEIVSIEREKTLDSGRSMYTAYVDYYVDGMPHAIKCGFKSSTFRIGQKMHVAYNTAAPHHAVVRPKATTYIIMFGFIVAGLVVCYLTLLK